MTLKFNAVVHVLGDLRDKRVFFPWKDTGGQSRGGEELEMTSHGKVGRQGIKENLHNQWGIK